MQVFHQCDYYKHPAFSGFLPGVAGLHGIPLWAFYVNRGQGLVSFGTESKNGSIAEFFSASNAYRVVSEQGFRTFIKPILNNSDDSENVSLYEPFARHVNAKNTCFSVDTDEISIKEENLELGVRIEVMYRALPNSRVASLIREVKLTNLTEKKLTFELIDGLSAIIPAGVDYGAVKSNLTTAQAWMLAQRHTKNTAVYHVAASMMDSANVEKTTKVHFAAGYRLDNDRLQKLNLIHDADVLFPAQQAMTVPVHFLNERLAVLEQKSQIESGKLPCAFFTELLELEAGEGSVLVEFYGAADSKDRMVEFFANLTSPAVIKSYFEQGRALMDDLTGVCETKTANGNFDAYCRQNFLDNVLRGGFPHIERTEEKDVYIPVYSRKHGDLERDYNWFVIPPEYYSQGWGNYRDVNQNRRSDVFFVPQAGFENLWEFVSLIQTDAYNPLVVQGRRYCLADDKKAPKELLNFPKSLALLSRSEFSPGELYHVIEEESTDAALVQKLFHKVLAASDTLVHAVHGEGFWIDHWTYNNDLLENYLCVFPDKRSDLLWKQRVYPYFNSTHYVLPRRKKWVINENTLRQYDAVKKIDARDGDKQIWMCAADATVYYASLGEKLTGLAAVKFLTRDPFGVGIEMEAGKPGWYDALNGLPGLLGSSLPESWELLRLVRILITDLVEGNADDVQVATEIYDLLLAIDGILNDFNDSEDSLQQRWDAMANIREEYREKAFHGFSGKCTHVPNSELLMILESMETDLQKGLQRGREKNNGVYPTYLIFQPKKISVIKTYIDTGEWESSPSFTLQCLPLFLEGLVRALAVEHNMSERLHIHEAVMNSELYDKKLKMLRVNASLDQESHEIGRARAFTPGWLENASIWTHMEYKYLLALLKAENYEAFWELAESMLVPFMNPDVYGRSIFENSSFIVSSAHPDVSLHGRGFVARLSGSTAEFISMWVLLFFGKDIFRMRHGQLEFHLQPCLPGKFFDSDGRISCVFMQGTQVIYQNCSKQDVFPGGNIQPGKITLQKRETLQTIEFSDGIVPSPYAEWIRDGHIEKIFVELD